MKRTTLSHFQGYSARVIDVRTAGAQADVRGDSAGTTLDIDGDGGVNIVGSTRTSAYQGGASDNDDDAAGVSGTIYPGAAGASVRYGRGRRSLFGR